MPITTRVVSSNPIDSEMYSIQHYVIKFVRDLQQVGGFLQVLRFSPPNKTDGHDITYMLLKVALSTITLMHSPTYLLCLKHIVSMSFEFNCLHPYLLQTMKVQIVNDRQTIPDVWCKSPIYLYSERLTFSILQLE